MEQPINVEAALIQRSVHARIHYDELETFRCFQVGKTSQLESISVPGELPALVLAHWMVAGFDPTVIVASFIDPALQSRKC